MKPTTCGSGRAWAQVLALLLLVVFLLPTSSCSDEDSVVMKPYSSLTGTWEGTLNGEGLRMELNEAKPGVITGRVIFGWPEPTDTLAIDIGTHTDADSMYLDVSCRAAFPPLRCTRFFSGRRESPNRISGDYHELYGHETRWTIREWTVRRRS